MGIVSFQSSNIAEVKMLKTRVFFHRKSYSISLMKTQYKKFSLSKELGGERGSGDTGLECILCLLNIVNV